MNPPRRALLDTSVVIDFPAARVAEHVDEVAVSAVTVAELHYGISVAADPVTQMHRRHLVEAVLEQFEVLDFDADTASYYGALAALVRQDSRKLRPRRMDLQIAATAARHGLALLTRDLNDFKGLESVLRVIEVS